MLEFRNVTKKFGTITALEDISFDIEDGSFVFVIGPSGSGKTTLLKLILREIKPDEGKIILDGKNTSDLPDNEIPKLRQNLGVIFQDYKVLPDRTVRENVEVALAVTGLPNEEWKARVDHVLELVNLIERSEFFPSQLAGGELQRVSMARALVVNPKIVLADEPTGNLDTSTGEKVLDFLEKLHKKGTTIVIVTHDPNIAKNHAKTIYSLLDGKIASVMRRKGNKWETRNK